MQWITLSFLPRILALTRLLLEFNCNFYYLSLFMCILMEFFDGSRNLIVDSRKLLKDPPKYQLLFTFPLLFAVAYAQNIYILLIFSLILSWRGKVTIKYMIFVSYFPRQMHYFLYFICIWPG